MRRIFSIFAVFILSTAYLTSQVPFFNIYYTDVSEFPKVKMHFNATNLAGQNLPSSQLNISDFSLSENGVDMKLNQDNSTNLEIKCGSSGVTIPISVVLAIDCTGSMTEDAGNSQTRFDWVKEAANIFLDSLKFTGNTEVTVIGFAGSSVVNSGWINNRVAAKSEIAKLPIISGVTNFNPPFLDQTNGVIKSFETAQPNTRRVTIFLTDGSHDWLGDPASFENEEISLKAIENNIEVYAVEVNVDNTNNRLNSLSRYTGGYFENVDTKNQLKNVFTKFYFDLQGSEDKCWFEYTAPLSCVGDESTRDVVASFNKYVPVYPLEQSFTYEIPDDKLISLNVSKTELLFSNNNGGTNSHKVRFTANKGDFNISNFMVSPDNGNFTITPANLDIPAGQSAEITIEYTGSEATSQEYTLSYVSNPCEGQEITLISPCSADFDENLTYSNVPLNTKRTLKASFTNTTSVNLIGNASITGANADKFTILTDNTVNLAPGEDVEFDVEFESDVQGDFTADLNFNVNTECGVFTTNLVANAVEQTLDLSPLDFGLVRIQTEKTETYTITNIEALPITITNIDWANTFTDFSQPIIVNGTLPITLAQGETLDIDVTFSPFSLGNLQAEINVTIQDVNTPAVISVTGIGTLPEIRANNIDFSSTDVGMTSSSELMTIENKGNEVLLISEIRLKSGAGNPEDFNIITTQLTNLSVDPNSSIDIEFEFEPTAGGNRTATVELIHNSAIGDVTPDKVYERTLTGTAVLNKMPHTFDLSDYNFNDVNTCQNGRYQYSITNDSQENWDLTLEIDNTTPNEFFVNGAKTYSFSLTPGQSEDVELSFEPSQLGTQSARLIITSSDNLVDGEATISGNGVQEIIPITVDNFNYTSAGSFAPSDEFNLSFELDIPQYQRLAFVQVNVQIEYNSKQVIPILNTLEISKAGWNAQIMSNDYVSGDNYMISIEMTSTMIHNELEKMNLSMNFKAMFSNVIDDQFTISADFAPNCIAFQTANKPLKVDFCGAEFSGLNFGEPNNLEKVYPNPISNSKDVEFSLLGSGRVDIQLIDLNGNIIKNYVQGDLEAGKYTFNLDINNVDNGVYFLQMRHFDFIETQKIVILK